MTVTHDFDNRVIVITGGARGLGYATAKRLVASNARVVITDLDGHSVITAAQQLGENAFARVHRISRLFLYGRDHR